MKLEVGEHGQLIAKNVFNPLTLMTDKGVPLSVCMRDDGFEIIYNGIRYDAKGGKMKPSVSIRSKKKVNKPAIYNVTTGMGRADRSSVPFLTDQQFEDFNTIGYTGRLRGKKISREKYLNSLGTGVYTVKQVRFDDGSFTEEFVIARVAPSELPTTNRK